MMFSNQSIPSSENKSKKVLITKYVEAKNILFLIIIDLQPFSRIQIAFI